MFSTWFLLNIAGVVALAIAKLTQQYILHTTKIFNGRASAVVTFVVQALFVILGIVLFDLKNQIFEIIKNLEAEPSGFLIYFV